jgi:hypothetical protein
MEKGQNFNHPKKGSRIEVEPIRREKDIKAIIQLAFRPPERPPFICYGNQ